MVSKPLLSSYRFLFKRNKILCIVFTLFLSYYLDIFLAKAKKSVVRTRVQIPAALLMSDLIRSLLSRRGVLLLLELM